MDLILLTVLVVAGRINIVVRIQGVAYRRVRKFWKAYSGPGLTACVGA